MDADLTDAARPLPPPGSSAERLTDERLREYLRWTEKPNAAFDSNERDLVREVLALRDRLAQDTPSEPAAPVLWEVYDPDGHPDVPRSRRRTVTDDRALAERWASDDYGVPVLAVRGLYAEPPAPVAAAPRMDEVRRLAVQAKAGRTPESTTWELAERVLGALDGEPIDPASRFAPGDAVTVGAQRGEYVSYVGGQFHTHRYRVVWPDGDRSTDVFTATDAEMGAPVAAAPTGEDDAAVERALDEAESWEVLEPLQEVNGQFSPETREELHHMLAAALAAARAAQDGNQ